MDVIGSPLVLVPPYSPDFNPIEQAWRKLRTALRQRKARSRRALARALCDLLPTISSADAQAWFRHGGYAPH